MAGKLIMCKGLPASGKSSWALKQLEEGKAKVRVNKDDIRAEQKKDWSYDLEKEVLRIRDFRISEALNRGFVVISDDTNFASKHEKQLRSLAAKYGATFEINDSFLQVPLEECLKRDALREFPVGPEVIKKMYTQFLATPQDVASNAADPQDVVMNPYIPDPSLPSAVICDLDGTLALHGKGTSNPRSPYDFKRCFDDEVNRPIHELINVLNENVDIIYLSGRDDSCYEDTSKWLNANGCPLGPLFMRRTGDKRKDSIVKYEIFDKKVRNKWNIMFVLDDRDQVVKMWRSIGLTCLQVNYGNF